MDIEADDLTTAHLLATHLQKVLGADNFTLES